MYSELFGLLFTPRLSNSLLVLLPSCTFLVASTVQLPSYRASTQSSFQDKDSNVTSKPHLRGRPW